MGKKKTTLADISKLADVSVSTVSRVLNFDETLNVHPDTRKNIIKIAEELSYEFNKNKEEKQKIGFYSAVSHLTESEDVFYHDLRTEIENYLKLKGIELETVTPDDTIKTIEKIDGIIVLDLSQDDNKTHWLEKLGKPLVFIDHNPNTTRYHSVEFDLSDSTNNVLAYLLEMGHQNIGFIGGVDSERRCADERENTYRNFMKSRNLLNEEYIRIGNFTSEDGYKNFKDLLTKQKEITAVFAANDSLVIGCYRAAYEMGLKVPEDVSIVGFNDIKIAKLLVPSLTTVSLEISKMAEIAIRFLDDIINLSIPPLKIIIPNQLVKRDSVKNIK